jgi:hypothetical protein
MRFPLSSMSRNAKNTTLRFMAALPQSIPSEGDNVSDESEQ